MLNKNALDIILKDPGAIFHNNDGLRGLISA